MTTLFHHVPRLLAALVLFASLTSAGRAQEALSDVQRFAIETTHPKMVAALEAGNFAKARAIAEQIIQWDPADPRHRYDLARVESRAGGVNVARSVAAMKQAITLGFNDAARLKSDPDLADLRASPQYAELLQTVERVAPRTVAASAEKSATAPTNVAGSAVAPAQRAPAPTVPPTAKPVSLPPLPPKSGHLIGRAVFEDGRPVPEFTVTYSGFEDGKLARTTYGGNLIETISDTKSAKNGRYEVKLPAGAYRVSTYVTYRYRDRTYLFDLQQLNPPQKHDYPGLRLDKLGNGLVRDFVLRMTGKRAITDESTEAGYYHAYIGGRVNFDVSQTTGLLGGGNKFSPTVGEAFPAESHIEVTFVPQGPRVDGSTGSSLIANVPLAQSSSWTFSQRGIFPGVYTTTARVITPDGHATPLRVSLTPARTILGGGAAYDELVMDWKTSVLVDFHPNDIKPGPSFGVKPVTVYLGP